VLSANIRANPRRKKFRNKNAAGASHPSRIVRGSSDLPHPPLARRDDASGPSALPRECRICQSWLRSRSCDHKAQPLRGPAAHSRYGAGSGRRPQRPGNQFAFARVSDMSPGDSPSRITGCCRPCRNHPASSENSHVFAAPTLSQNRAVRNKKTSRTCAETVDETSSLWKPEEN
jgi:hypothetical protein